MTTSNRGAPRLNRRTKTMDKTNDRTGGDSNISPIVCPVQDRHRPKAKGPKPLLGGTEPRKRDADGHLIPRPMIDPHSFWKYEKP